MTGGETILAELERRAAPVAALEAEECSGLYALFLAPGGALPEVPANGVLYVGCSANLAQREFDTHFASGKTGFSSLRRSIGALLKEELWLRAIPRAPGPSPTNVRNYRFDDAGERRLSDWMAVHLHVAVAAHPQPEDVERDLISLACPALNLTGWDNPARVEIKRLRKVCAEEAAAARGH